MKIVGIVGGIASGKTRAAEFFKECGAAVLHADEMGHHVLCEPKIRQAAEDRWGDEILDATGKIDRQRLAAIVFDDQEELAFLENLTHPRIKEQFLAELDRLREKEIPVVILDAALLLETDWHSLCQKIVFIEASPEIREKLAAQRGWKKEELIRRESRQISLEEKRAVADYTIHNNGSAETLRKEISRVWDSLQAI